MGSCFQKICNRHAAEGLRQLLLERHDASARGAGVQLRAALMTARIEATGQRDASLRSAGNLGDGNAVRCARQAVPTMGALFRFQDPCVCELAGNRSAKGVRKTMPPRERSHRDVVRPRRARAVARRRAISVAREKLSMRTPITFVGVWQNLDPASRSKRAYEQTRERPPALLTDSLCSVVLCGYAGAGAPAPKAFAFPNPP